VTHDDMTARPEDLFFDEAYYRNGLGPEPYQRSVHWTRFFDGVADEIVRTLQPATVLDAGCAIGMLTEALRARGADARGVDVSSYAISQVPRELAPFCQVGSLTEPIEGHFDLVTCIEVLEHIPPRDSRQALRTLTQLTDTILFSSTPHHLTEPSHININPIQEWLRLFAELGFEPDIRYDAGFVCAHAFVVKRRAESLSEGVADLFARHLTLRSKLSPAKEHGFAGTINAVLPADVNGNSQAGEESPLDLDSSALHDELRLAKNQAAMLQASSDSVFASPGWRVVSGYRNWLHSRIWPRTRLRGLYEPVARWLLKRLSSRQSRTASAATPKPQVRTLAATTAGDPLAAGQEIRLCWDGPTDDQRVLGLIELWGWATAESGIHTVEATIDDEVILPVKHGLPRLDVLKHLPALSPGLKPGFRLWWDTTLCTPGVHRVRITAESAQGRASIERTFLVDQRDQYDVWQLLNEPSYAETQRMRRRIETFSERPKISILTLVYQSDLEHLALCISSVRCQIYPNWELCLVDDGSSDSELTAYLESLTRQDSRIKLTTLPTNRGIAEATNTALEMAAGDFVAFLDHDDEIADFALFEVAKALNSKPELDVIYSDEDKLDEKGKRFFPFFKPDWSPDLLRSCNYVCHFLIARKKLVEEVGRLRSEFDGSQDYDLILRLTERTDGIYHIPKVLYHWRTSVCSTASGPEAKPKASEAGARALGEHLQRSKIDASIAEIGPSRYRPKYEIADQARVAIIVPTGGNISKLNEALSTIIAKTNYPHYEILVVDNSSDGRVQEALTTFRSLDVQLRRLDKRGQPFNFSRLCNEAVSETDAPCLLFLNDDVSVITADWLGALLEHLQRPEVGIVGALLRYPDDTIQHAGIVVGLFNCCGQAFRGLPDEECYMGLHGMTRNVSAVTGACLLTRREQFVAFGGFDQTNLPIAFQDVDLCLRYREKGYLVVYTPFAELYHDESASKSESEKIAGLPEIEYMRKRWPDYIANDPYYGPNLTRESESYALRLEIATLRFLNLERGSDAP